MQNKKVSAKEDFLRLLGPEVLACVWVSEKPLSQRELPYWWLDYLMDGVLESHVHSLPENPKSFLTANHYNENFYLLQVEKSYPDLNNALQETFHIIETHKERKEEKKKVLCLTQNPQHFSVPAIKKNQSFDFEIVLY